RRRHTRSKRDWSSDVCSSDLAVANATGEAACGPSQSDERSGIHGLYDICRVLHVSSAQTLRASLDALIAFSKASSQTARVPVCRSEERRVGKEWRARVWSCR